MAGLPPYSVIRDDGTTRDLCRSSDRQLNSLFGEIRRGSRDPRREYDQGFHPPVRAYKKEKEEIQRYYDNLRVYNSFCFLSAIPPPKALADMLQQYAHWLGLEDGDVLPFLDADSTLASIAAENIVTADAQGRVMGDPCPPSKRRSQLVIRSIPTKLHPTRHRGPAVWPRTFGPHSKTSFSRSPS